MLGKLFKHDFRSLSRVLVPTHLAILAATIIATLGFAFNIRSGYSSFDGSIALQSMRVISALLSGLMMVAIFASVFLVAFIIFQRFYKSFMSDEGYLTFTLPVTTSQLLWSKLLTAGLWTIINSVVLIFCVLIFVAFGTSSISFYNAEAFQELGRFFAEVNINLGSRLVLPIIEFVIFMIIGVAYSILEVYLSLILGGIMCKNHKILAAIGAYFGINIVVGIISSIAQTAFLTRLALNSAFLNFQANTPGEAFDLLFGAFNPYALFIAAFSAVMAVVFFLVSHYLLKNKLNLE